MSRYTSAYVTFVRGLEEVESLRKIAKIKEREDPVGDRHEINAVCRGAIVLLSAHLEAYVKDLGESVLDAIHAQNVLRGGLHSAIFYHISKDVIDDLLEAKEPSKIAEKVFLFLDSDLSHWSKDGPFPIPLPVDRFNKGFSNPGVDKIRAYFCRFGYSDFKSDLGRHLRANGPPTINMVNHLVDTRNKIAHGDSFVTKTPAELADMIAFTRKFGMATDSVFASWCKVNLCSIRS